MVSKKKTVIMGLSLWIVAVIAYLILAFLQITAVGIVEGVVALVWIAIAAIIASAIIALLTKEREGMLNYAALAFTAVIVYEIATLLIDYVMTMLPV